MDSRELHEEVLQLLKVQRHDFMNHLQVIYTMVQLGKTDQALSYITKLSRNPEALVPKELVESGITLGREEGGYHD